MKMSLGLPFFLFIYDQTIFIPMPIAFAGNQSGMRAKEKLSL